MLNDVGDILNSVAWPLISSAASTGEPPSGDDEPGALAGPSRPEPRTQHSPGTRGKRRTLPPPPPPPQTQKQSHKGKENEQGGGLAGILLVAML